VFTSLQQLFQQHKTNNDLFISKLMNGGANDGITNKHGGDVPMHLLIETSKNKRSSNLTSKILQDAAIVQYITNEVSTE
jgi:hypothetical protein